MGLRGDRVGDHRVGVTDGGHRDARTHIDQVVAVHVDEHTTTGTLDEDRQPNTDPGGDRLGLLGQQPLGTRTGNLGDEPALLGDLGVHQGRVHASSTQR